MMQTQPRSNTWLSWLLACASLGAKLGLVLSLVWCEGLMVYFSSSVLWTGWLTNRTAISLELLMTLPALLMTMIVVVGVMVVIAVTVAAPLGAVTAVGLGAMVWAGRRWLNTAGAMALGGALCWAVSLGLGEISVPVGHGLSQPLKEMRLWWSASAIYIAAGAWAGWQFYMRQRRANPPAPREN